MLAHTSGQISVNFSLFFQHIILVLVLKVIILIISRVIEIDI